MELTQSTFVNLSVNSPLDSFVSFKTTEGIVALSRELKELMNDDLINREISQRFNPCLFLGHYLMRKNHSINGHFSLVKLLTEYSQIENMTGRKAVPLSVRKS